MFNWNIGVGELLQIAAIIGGGFWAIFTISAKISGISKDHEKEHEDNLARFRAIEEQLKQLTDIVIKMARQEEKIHHLEDRIIELYGKIEQVNNQLNNSKSIPTPSRRRKS